MNPIDVEKLIDTPFGETYVKQIGKGAPVFVIHGGPGFDHRYLVSGLETLAEKRTLIFYDQPGCGQSATPESISPLDVFSHFRWLSHHLCEGQPAGVIAHSWGALVFIAALLDERLSKDPVATFQEGLLINPVPLSFTNYLSCVQNLLNKIGFFKRLKLNWRLAVEPDGTKIMKELLPYYVVDKTSLPTASLPLNKTTYLQINQQLKDFDYTPKLDQLPRLSSIIGAEDFTTTDLIEELISHLATNHIMEEVGHFPFWEAPTAFQDILHASFKIGE